MDWSADALARFAHATHQSCPGRTPGPAQAARVAAAQAEADAEKQSSPSIRAMFDNSARRFRELAARFEPVRIGGRE
jgi:hypothetical protein